MTKRETERKTVGQKPEPKEEGKKEDKQVKTRQREDR